MLPLPFRPLRLDDDFPIGLASEAALQIAHAKRATDALPAHSEQNLQTGRGFSWR
jgi:hypothetical protein